MAGFDPVTSQGVAITNLFWLLLALSFLLLLFVVGWLTYALVRFRARPGDPDPPQAAGSRRLEIAWTAAPLALLAIIFFLTVGTVRAVERPDASPVRLVVIGHQWWWEVRYPDLGVTTANEPHVPVGTPLQIEIESADVLHSFWIPQFGFMRDAVPNKTNVIRVRVERPGTYDGACTQFCGLQHAWMRSRVIAQPPAEFETWVQQQRQPAAPPGSSLALRGQQILLANTCVSCHAIQGTTAAGQVAPNLTHLGSRTTIGAGVAANTPEQLRSWIQNPQAIKPGVLMPGYSFSSDELTALVTYLEGLR